MKVLKETRDSHSLKLELEAAAGSIVELYVRRNGPKLNLHVEGGTLIAAKVAGEQSDIDRVTVQFPEGTGYQQRVLALSW
jgi:hypothetical protein